MSGEFGRGDLLVAVEAAIETIDGVEQALVASMTTLASDTFTGFTIKVALLHEPVSRPEVTR